MYRLVFSLPFKPLPDGPDVGVLSNPVVLRHDGGVTLTCGRDEDLVGGIAVKRRGQPAAGDEYWTRKLEQLKPGSSDGSVDPVFDRPVQHQLAFLSLLGHLPDGDQRQCERSGRAAALDGTTSGR